MSFRKRLARFNRVVTNPIQGLWAPYVPPWAVVVHEGRKSGKTYRTPVSAFVRDGVMAVALPYGDDTDWLRNLQAAGGGELRRRGRRLYLTNLRVLTRSDDLPRPARVASRFAPKVLVADVE